jgi:hypothetical protein
MSKDHMAHELDVHRRARHQRLTPWRPGIIKKPSVTLSREVKWNAAAVMAGHPGPPEVLKAQRRQGRRR